jgi:hypothetical protein
MDPPDIHNGRRGGRLRALRPAGTGPSFVRREPHVAPHGGGHGVPEVRRFAPTIATIHPMVQHMAGTTVRIGMRHLSPGYAVVQHVQE